MQLLLENTTGLSILNMHKQLKEQNIGKQFLANFLANVFFVMRFSLHFTQSPCLSCVIYGEVFNFFAQNMLFHYT